LRQRLRQWFSQLDLFGSGSILAKTDQAPATSTPSASALSHSQMEIVFAPRLRKGWRLEWRGIGSAKLTLPRYMEQEAFSEVRAWIIDWCGLTRRRRTQPIRDELKALEKRIWAETDRILQALGTPVVGRGERLPPIRSQGRVHDLAPHFAFVNEHYFQGTLQCRVTWSGRAGGLSYHSKRKDPQSGETVDLVSISRGYDFENCPDYALRGILYHECLHAAIPPLKREKRRVVHGRDFRERERQFEHYQEWKRWHAEVLPRNVRKLIRDARSR